MIGTAVIIFREVLEAALIVGLVLAATRGVVGRLRLVLFGIIAGVIGAIVLALLGDTIAPLVDGMGQEVLQALILFAAVLMLSWHLLWMRQHAVKLSQELKSVGQAVLDGEKGPIMLAVIVALAILREGSEVVLFLYGLTAAGVSSLELLVGSSLGLLAGLIAGTTLYLGISRIPVSKLFQVSAWLIMLLIAGLASQAANYLVQADLLPAMGTDLWDSSFLLSEQTAIGKVLHILVGYVDHPMGVQVLVYVVTIVLLLIAMKMIKRQSNEYQVKTTS